MNDSFSNQVDQLIRESIARFDSDADISPSDIAKDVISKMDPDNVGPELVRYSANLHVRQISRGILRREFDPVSPDNPQSEMFERLQDRYPCSRGDDSVYVKRLRMTKKERNAISSGLRKEVAAKQSHANAMDAETADLDSQGFFDGEEP